MANSTASTPSFGRHSLELLGKKLATFTKSNTLPKDSLASIDLASLKADFKNNKNAFHEHIPSLSRKLLGKTPIGRYGSMAGKFVPKTTFEKATDMAFSQIGKLAQRWADADLARDSRFTSKTLDDSERHALAKAIANQNRSLATLGSASNIAGLAGILVDTLWLLTVSLRSIFQIAQIYDKPLTGKQGIAIAYELLAKTDLKKLQDKQTLLAGLGVVEAIADDGFGAYRMDNNDSKEAQTDTGQDYSQSSIGDVKGVQDMFGKVEQIAGQLNVNLYGFNFGFLHKVLPLSAVGIGATYNNIIINEVVQLAQATFAPLPKLANLHVKDDKDDMPSVDN